jgi:hypothetical protein
MFKYDDIEMAKKTYSCWLAECAYYGSMRELSRRLEESDIGFEPCEMDHSDFHEAMQEEPGSAWWDEPHNGAKAHLVFWAYLLMWGDLENAKEEHKNFLRSMKNGGKYDFEMDGWSE